MKKEDELILDLLNRSGPKLLALLNRLTLDEHTAEELLQELFMRLCRKNGLAAVRNLEAYACRTAIHLALDDRRRQKQARLFLRARRPDEASPPAALSPEDREQIERILDAAGQLAGHMRECFVLRYIEQMDYAGIAGRLDKTPKQVRALCSKALGRIRQIVNQDVGVDAHNEVKHG